MRNYWIQSNMDRGWNVRVAGYLQSFFIWECMIPWQVNQGESLLGCGVYIRRRLVRMCVYELMHDLCGVYRWGEKSNIYSRIYLFNTTIENIHNNWLGNQVYIVLCLALRHTTLKIQEKWQQSPSKPICCWLL